MKNSLDYEKCCALCEKATITDEGNVICSKKGPVSDTFSCRKFKFDLLKYEPKKAKELPKFEPVILDEN